jgi:uncharacterized damage-inducible protein DinB
MRVFDRMLEHDQWATSQLLNTASPLTEEQMNQEFDIGHRTLRATFEHMIMNVEGWTAAFTGQEPTVSGTSIAEFTERHDRAYPAFAAAAQTFEAAGRLDETFTDPFGEPQTFGAAFLMIILHNEGHRTEVLHILRRLGLDHVPEVDYGLWDFVRRGLAH